MGCCGRPVRESTIGVEMNVLSLFDGMSCGQLALQRADVHYDNYFASEIDKYAIKITQKNFPNTIQLGDINNWIDWNLPQIDLLIGGSPCQGVAVAGQGLNFSDPRSQLFFRFVDCLKWYKPKWFLLENVKMKKEWQNIISEYLGVEPIEINSALVSAQSRKRLYWTNIPNIIQPGNKGIFLRDIIENGEVDRDKSYCIDANYFKGGSLKMYLEKSKRQIVNLPFHQSEKRLMVKTIPHGYIKEEIKERDKYPSLVGQDSSTKYVIRCIQTGIADINAIDIINRTYDVEGKSPALTSMQGGHREPKITVSRTTWRKLTPLECERLQTAPDNYTEGVSNTQRYKMIGNGWTVDVIAHIFSFIPESLLELK